MIKLTKNKIIILIIILIIGISVGIYFIFKNKNKNTTTKYSASKTSTNEDQNNTSISTNTLNSTQNNIAENNTVNNNQNNVDHNVVQVPAEPPIAEPPKEEAIASFTTKIYNKDSGRQNNIAITTSKLNDTIVKNGSNFSFCNTVGPATSAKGYQEADIFDKDGNKKKGLGGGNCQVSTTLYNAVLKISSLQVTERHEHSNKVPYIKNGKDAAVAYGSYDFKFKNNSGFDIKIKATATANNVTITLNKIY